MKVAFDVGGTFTDVVIVLPDGNLATFKFLSLQADLGENVAKCIETSREKSLGGEVTGIVHATTIASNIVTELNGATIGLITTKGFRDELEIRRFVRPAATGFFWERKPPLIPRRRRLTVAERIGARGEVLIPLNEGELDRVIQALRKQSVEAIAVSFLNSYANPVHERRVAEILRSQMPELDVAVSCEILPEMGEYERTSTTALTAYLAPKVNAYLTDLEASTRKYHPSLFIMQANGGLVPSEHARRFPAGIIESGPAAGVLGACAVASQLGIAHAVSLDMGGTTAKTMLIKDGQAGERPSMDVGAGLAAGTGYALRFAGFDLIEIGAGGGSIAWVDPGGALRVGPKSAGAAPGPVCYGRGGAIPTVTDANVMLGYMNPSTLAGGTVHIDKGAAVRAVEDGLCVRLQITAEEVALGIHQVANIMMMRALRAVTTERGQDPRQCTLIAFGGAGPIHAAHLADNLEIARVVIPLYPGLFSALGLLLADLRFDYLQSLPGSLNQLTVDQMLDGYRKLTARAKTELTAIGIEPESARWHRLIDLNYQGQKTQLTVRFPEEGSASELKTGLAKRFHGEHRRIYAYEQTDESIAVLNVRLRVSASGGTVSLKEIGEKFLKHATASMCAEGVRQVHFYGEKHPLATRVLSRGSLLQGDVLGPAVLEEFDTTIVVPPKWRASIDEYANVILSHEKDGVGVDEKQGELKGRKTL